MTKYGCLSNHLDQSQSEILSNKPKQSNTSEQTATACLNQPTKSCTKSQLTKVNSKLNARTINNLELADPSAETRNLIARWRNIVKPGVYRQSGGLWKKYHEPRLLCNERRIMEEQLPIAIRNIHNRQADQPQGFQLQERCNEQWTVDPFWEVDRPQRQQLQREDEPRPSSSKIQQAPMEQGQIGSEMKKNRKYWRSRQSTGPNTWASRACNT